jgi:predicted DsbA family dithiol-disulfide isomerase
VTGGVLAWGLSLSCVVPVVLGESVTGEGKQPGAAGVHLIVQVEIWSDIVCAWCYLGKHRFVRQAEDAQRLMERRAAQDGLTFHLDGLRSGNTRDAHRLLQFARQRARQVELVERLHRAYFTEQISVFGHASLTELAVDVGLDRDGVLAVLTGDVYDEGVDADEVMARSLGATGVPLFVIDRRYGISGAQPAQIIAEVLERAWADTKATAS